jgi:hypothetical protein
MPVPTIDEVAANIAAVEAIESEIDDAITVLVKHVDWIGNSGQRRGDGLRDVIYNWIERDPDDAFWYALSEFAEVHDRSGFDRGLRDAAIRLMFAADEGASELGNNDLLSARVLRHLREAQAAIGPELDRIEAEA